jgi:antitoxin (DNA-binding transcriptional repressor) of toxin-antitoxin stability system
MRSHFDIMGFSAIMYLCVRKKVKFMSAIESVGIREFRTHLYKYTRENQEPIALTSHGETIGYYIPAQTQAQKKDLESLRQAVTKLSNMLAEKGLSEDDIVGDFQELRKQSN